MGEPAVPVVSGSAPSAGGTGSNTRESNAIEVVSGHSAVTCPSGSAAATGARVDPVATSAGAPHDPPCACCANRIAPFVLLCQTAVVVSVPSITSAGPLLSPVLVSSG